MTATTEAKLTSTGFRQRLLDAVAENDAYQRERQAADEAAAARQTLTAFVELFGFQPERVMGTFATADGVTLRYNPGGYEWRACWHVQGNCPHCGELAETDELYEVFEIAQAVAQFKVSYRHHCHRPAPDVPSAAEQLDAAIRRICREVAGEYGE